MVAVEIWVTVDDLRKRRDSLGYHRRSAPV